MTQATIDIVHGLIVNGLSAVCGRGLRWATGKTRKVRDLSPVVKSDSQISTILQKAIAVVGKSGRFGDQRRTEKLRLFLSSPDAESIIRQIYAGELSTASPSSMALVEKEFSASLALHLGQSEADSGGAARELFELLVAGCKRTLKICIDKGFLSAHEAMDELRHRIVLDELTGIQKNLDLLTAGNKPDLHAVLQFEKKYRQQVGARHRYIIPPHFDAARKVPIDDIYVPPAFIPALSKKADRPTMLKVSAFLARVYRAVILGNPGGGKSTFAHKLCHDLATRYSERLFAGRQVSPVLVVVREYGARRKTHNCSILQFIEETANSTYQVEPVAGSFEYLLLNGRVIVVFDGLDELIDTGYRQEISSDIEAFCTLYPALPVLVTSREVGYEQAPLDEKRFEIFRVSPFDEEQVSEYAKKWFSVDKDLPPDQQTQKAKAFLEESKIVPDLRSNPLMLALMCNIYRGEHYIPRNRPEVYEKCATMLFERWDKSRGILVPLPFEAHIKPAMQFLAHWIYGDEALQGGVTEDQLTAKASEYLVEWRFEDFAEAEKAAREFIEFCRDRAWVFTDTGTTKQGQRLYQFTHRTFLEYFTAAHVVRTNPTPDRLGLLIRPKISKQEWDVVAQLAFQIQHRNIEGAADQLLMGVVAEAGKLGGQAEWNLLSFAARCLEFMVPKPRITREITVACLDRCLRWGNLDFKGGGEPQSGEPAPILAGLVWAASENRATIASTIQGTLVARVNSPDEVDSVVAVDLGIHLPLCLHLGERPVPPESDTLQFWDAVSDAIYVASSERIQSLAPRHVLASVELFRRQNADISDIIRWHGTEAVFQDTPHIMIPSFWTWSPAQQLLRAALLSGDPSNVTPALQRDMSQISELGRILLLRPTPWLTRTRYGPPALPRWALDVESPGSGKPASGHAADPQFVFGAFCIIAPLLEATPEPEVRFLLNTLGKSQTPLLLRLRPFLLPRFFNVDPVWAQSSAAAAKFDARQTELVTGWTRKEISFVDTMPPEHVSGELDFSP
jgi:hypothetical protein